MREGTVEHIPDEVVDPSRLWDGVHLVEDEDGGDVAEEAQQSEHALVERLSREPAVGQFSVIALFKRLDLLGEHSGLHNLVNLWKFVSETILEKKLLGHSLHRGHGDMCC